MKALKVLTGLAAILLVVLLPLLAAGCTITEVPPQPTTPARTTLVIAASNSTADSKRQADYVGDGIDDDKEIQAAIDEVTAAGGGKVVLVEGIYNANKYIKVKSNVSLEGQGFGTIIKLTAGTHEGFIVYLRQGESDNASVRNLKIDGNGAKQTIYSVGLFIDANDVNIENVWVANSLSDNIVVAGPAQRVNLNRIFSSNAGVGAEIGERGAGLEILNNARQITVNQIQIWDCAESQGGIVIKAHDYEDGPRDVIISDAYIYNSFRGLSFSRMSWPPKHLSPPQSIIIHDIVIDTTTGAETAYGRLPAAILVDGESVSDLQINNFIVRNTASMGVLILPGNPGVRLSGGDVYNATDDSYHIYSSGDTEVTNSTARNGGGNGFVVMGEGGRYSNLSVYDHDMDSFQINGNDNELINSYSYNAGRSGFRIMNNATGNKIINGTTQASGSEGIFVAGDYTVVEGFKVKDEIVGCYINDGDYLTIKGNDFHDAATPIKFAPGQPKEHSQISDNIM